jgi:hypothetical protein
MLSKLDSVQQSLQIIKTNQGRTDSDDSQLQWNQNCATILDKTLEKVQRLNTEEKQVQQELHKPEAQQPKPKNLNTRLQNKTTEVRPGEDTNATYLKTEWQPNVPNQTETISSTQTEGTRVAQEMIMLICDSNGKGIDPSSTKHVKKETRYTLDDAMREVPKVDSPGDSTDVILMTGLNDSRINQNPVPVLVEKMDQTARLYQEKFPKSRLHICSVASVTKKQQDLNLELKNLTMKNNCSFLDFPAYDREKGGIRGILDGIHFTNIDVKILAKELKRSLYGFNLGPHCLTKTETQVQLLMQQNARRPNVMPIQNMPSPSLSGLMGALTTFFESASQKMAYF